MEPIMFFNSVDHLEQHCSKCDNKIEFGVTTQFDDAQEVHKCLKCGNQL